MALVLVVTAVTGDDAPVGISQRTPTSGAVISSAVPSSTTVAAPTTIVVEEGDGDDGDAQAVGGASAAPEEAPGLVITNSGSATANVGGNVVSGGPAGEDGNVVTGDATAVGNVSSVRTP